MRRSVSKCVSLLFAKGRHYGAERAIRWALPHISSYCSFIGTSTIFINYFLDSASNAVVSCAIIPQNTAAKLECIDLLDLRLQSAEEYNAGWT